MFDDGNELRQVFAFLFVLGPWCLASTCSVAAMIRPVSAREWRRADLLSKTALIAFGFGGAFFAPWVALILHGGLVHDSFRFTPTDFAVLAMLPLALLAPRLAISRSPGLGVVSRRAIPARKATAGRSQ